MEFNLIQQLQKTKNNNLPSFLNEQYVSYEMEIAENSYEVLIPDSKSALFEKWIDGNKILNKDKLVKMTHQLNGIFKKI